MSSFQLIELAFDPEDTKPTLEDDLTLTVVGRDIDKLDDVDHLKIVSKQLLKIIVHKQAMMRGLCKRLVEAETGGKVKRISVSKAKKNYKLVKLATKAELCLSRDNAKKIIKKAEKLNKTPLPK